MSKKTKPSKKTKGEVPKIEFVTTEDARAYLVDQRIGSGLSQSQVAKMMGVNQGYISTFEAGGRSKEPFLSSLTKYAAALGVELSLAVTEPGPKEGE